MGRILHMVAALPGPARTVGHPTSEAVHCRPDLIAAPLVKLRDGSWVIIGFRNLEPKGIDAFEIVDPIPVGLDDEGYRVAR